MIFSICSKFIREVSIDFLFIEDDVDGSCVLIGNIFSLIKDGRYSKIFGVKLFFFIGMELWKVWYNRFELVVNFNRWDEYEKL